MIDYTRDEHTGVFSSVKVNGKAVMKSHLNALNKAVASGTFKMYAEDTYTIGGMNSSVEVTALAFAVYQWTKFWYSRYNMGTGDKLCPTRVGTYDNMRYLFMALCPEGYDIVS
jgi:hypothetical protein